MVSTAIAAEVTGVIRDFGTDVEARGRALGSSVRHLVLSAGVGESSRARIAREINAPPAHVLSWIASGFDAASALLVSDSTDVVIVDRSLTRC